MLNNIRIFVFKDEPLFGNRFFTPDVEGYFISMLGKNPSKIRHLKIFLSATVDETSSFEERIIDRSKTVITIKSYFDFHEYFNSDNYHRKKLLFTMLCKTVSDLFSFQTLDTQVIKAIYNEAVRQDFIFKWIFNNALFAIGSHYICMQYTSDVNIYRIYEVLYSSEKNEIARRCIFIDDVSTFKIGKVLIMDDLNFSYYFIGPTKEFKSSVENILTESEITTMVNTSKFFKD